VTALPVVLIKLFILSKLKSLIGKIGKYKNKKIL